MDIKTVALGSIYTMISRLVVLACGFAVTIALARNLGPDLFGLYSVILSILVWVEYTVSMGIPSVYRKIISENVEAMPSILSTIKRVALPYCLAIAALYCLASPAVAQGMADPRLVLLLIVSSIDIPAFGIYATYMGVLNGRGRFFSQSLLASVYSISRTLVIVAAVMLGFGVVGALIGNAIGSLLGLAMALYLVGRMVAEDRRRRIYSDRLIDLNLRSRMATYGIPYLANFLIASVLIHLDIWLVKALTEDEATVNAVVGFYAVAYNLARIPFFLIGGITFTVFPAISMAAFQNRRVDAQKQIAHSLRMVLFIVVPMAAMVLSTGDRIIEFLFSDAYLPAEIALKILFTGVSLFSIYLFFITIIAAEDRQKISLSISLLLVPLAFALHYHLIPAYGIEGAAAATLAVSVVGVTVAGAYVWKRFGALVYVGDLTKLALANGGLYFLSRYEMLYELNLVLGYVLLSMAYLLFLVVLKVVDVRGVRDMIARVTNPARKGLE